MASKELLESIEAYKKAKKLADTFEKQREDYRATANAAYAEAWQSISIDGLVNETAKLKYVADFASFSVPGIEDVTIRFELNMFSKKGTVDDMFRINLNRISFGSYNSYEDALRRTDSIKESIKSIDNLIEIQKTVGDALRKAFTYFERNKTVFKEIVAKSKAIYEYPEKLKTAPNLDEELWQLKESIKSELLTTAAKDGLSFNQRTFSELFKKAEANADFLSSISTYSSIIFKSRDKFADEITGHTNSRNLDKTQIVPLMFDKANDRPVEIKKLRLAKVSKKSASVIVDEVDKQVVQSDFDYDSILFTSYSTRKNAYYIEPSKKLKNIKTATSISRLLVLAAIYSDKLSEQVLSAFE